MGKRENRLRRWIALPFYFIALVLDFLSDGFTVLAAKISGDPRPF
jgi:hypothetical protein